MCICIIIITTVQFILIIWVYLLHMIYENHYIFDQKLFLYNSIVQHVDAHLMYNNLVQVKRTMRKQ